MTTIKDTLIEIFNDLGGCAYLFEVYREYHDRFSGKVTKQYQASIRRVIETYSKDSKNFNGIEDIFYSVAGIGSGHWGLLPKYRTKENQSYFPSEIEKGDIFKR